MHACKVDVAAGILGMIVYWRQLEFYNRYSDLWMIIVGELPTKILNLVQPVTCDGYKHYSQETERWEKFTVFEDLIETAKGKTLQELADD